MCARHLSQAGHLLLCPALPRHPPDCTASPARGLMNGLGRWSGWTRAKCESFANTHQPHPHLIGQSDPGAAELHKQGHLPCRRGVPLPGTAQNPATDSNAPGVRVTGATPRPSHRRVLLRGAAPGTGPWLKDLLPGMFPPTTGTAPTQGPCSGTSEATEFLLHHWPVVSLPRAC